MALDPARLGAAFQATFVAAGAIPGPALTTLCDGLANDIITEFTEHAELVIDLGPPPTGTIE